MLSSLRRALILSLPFLIVACGDASSKSGKAESHPKSDAAYPDAAGAKADMFLGKADAPVTVIEYASVTCPHCAAFHQEVFPAIKEKFIDTGKVKFVFREFPTAPQQLSAIGSMLARCAADKGGSPAYFAVVGALFENQFTWAHGEDPKGALMKIAGQAGMDETAFTACLTRQDVLDVINENVTIANDKYNVDATPTFIIGGEPQRVDSIEDFEKAYEAVAAKKKN
jgi:protein-disulfide isomerase